MSFAAPVAERISHVTVVHEQQRDDPYHWIREKTNEKVIDYLNKGKYIGLFSL
jgi:protease II